MKGVNKILMEARIETLKAKNSEDQEYLVYPRTLIKCITNEKGDNLEDTLKEFITENGGGSGEVPDGVTYVNTSESEDIGEVAETKLNTGANYHQTIVELSTDYKALKYVQVLRNKNNQHNGMD